MATGAEFWNKVALKYSKSTISDEASYQYKLEATRAQLAPEMKMLEIGCGTGSTAMVHAPNIREILATDISSAMLEIARDKTKAAGIDNITYVETSVEALDQPEASFDVVLGMSVLHLLEDKDVAIDKVFKFLKPGGRFFSSTVCMNDRLLYRLVILLAPIGRMFGLLPPYISAFKQQDLIASLKRAGFELEDVWLPGKGKAVFIIARKPE